MPKHGKGEEHSAEADLDVPGDIETEPNANLLVRIRRLCRAVTNRELNEHHRREQGTSDEVARGAKGRSHRRTAQPQEVSESSAADADRRPEKSGCGGRCRKGQGCEEEKRIEDTGAEATDGSCLDPSNFLIGCHGSSSIARCHA
jgi:hypothetical protein